MSQFGMQMPGARLRRSASPDVYTGLMVLSTAFLLAACIIMFGAASKVGKGGSAFTLQEAAKIEIAGAKK